MGRFALVARDGPGSLLAHSGMPRRRRFTVRHRKRSNLDRPAGGQSAGGRSAQSPGPAIYSRAMTSPAPLAARFSVDSGDSSADESMPQDEVDRGGHGQLTVEVTERATEPQDHSLSVDFGDLLFWISPEVTTDFRLSSLTLLGTSAHIGCGRLSASLASTGSPGGAEREARRDRRVDRVDRSRLGHRSPARGGGLPTIAPDGVLARRRRIRRAHDRSRRRGPQDRAEARPEPASRVAGVVVRLPTFSPRASGARRV